MNKEMVEIMEIKEDLSNLRTSTEEEIAKITKKIKDNKSENKRLIETKFEEILDTVNFSVNNNPNVPASVKENHNGNIDKLVDQKIEEYGKQKDKEFGDLTSVVEEIADRLVDENKGIKSRIQELEKNSTGADVEGAIANTNKIVKVLEKDIKEEIEKNNDKIKEFKEQQENNLYRIETLEIQIEEIAKKIASENQNELSEQIVILEKKYQGEKLETNEEIKSIKEQLDILKEKIISENDINEIIDQKIVQNEELEKILEDLQGIQEMQQANIKELQQKIEKQDEKIEKVENKIETKIPTKQIAELKEKFMELKEEQKDQNSKLGQIEGLQIVHNEKLKDIEANQEKIDGIEEKIENLENNQTIKAEEINELNEKNSEHSEKIETLIALVQEHEKIIGEYEEKSKEIEEKVNSSDEIIKNASVSKEKILEEVANTYGKQADGIEDRINLLEKNQNDQEEKLNNYKNGQEEKLDNYIKEQDEKLNNYKEEVSGILEKYTSVKENKDKKSQEELTEKIEESKKELNEKIETYQKELNENIEGYKTEQDEIVNETADRVEAVENAIKKLSEKQQNYSLSLNFLNKNLETYKEENEKNTENIQNTVSEIENANKAQEEVIVGKIGDIEERLGKINEIEERIQRFENDNQTQGQETVDRIESLEQNIIEIQTAQNNQAEEVNGKIKSLNTKIASIKDLINNNEQDTINADLQAKIDELQANLAKFEEDKLTEIKNKQEETARKVKNLAIAMEERLEVYETNTQAPIDELNQKITDQNNSIDALEEKSKKYADEKLKQANKEIQNLQIKLEELNENIAQETEENYTKLQANNEEILNGKIKDMQNKSNKVFTQQLNKIKTENQTIITEQMQSINSQVSQIINQELDKIKQENTKIINDKLTRIQLQSEVELEKKVRKIKTEYDKKLKAMQQVLNNFMQENGKTASSRKRNTTSGATQVFAYEPVEETDGYSKNLYKKIQSQQIKQAAQNYGDDLDDTDIINFFDVDDE